MSTECVSVAQKQAAIGVRMHSGWGALVALSAQPSRPDSIELLDRRRIVVIDERARGVKQPYHYAAEIDLADADAFLRECAASSERLAEAALREVIRDLSGRGYRVAGGAVLRAAGRALPSLPEILASHALIHTAEGEFFRDAVTRASERLEVRVTALRERDLEKLVKSAFGNEAPRIQKSIAGLGKMAGPPWTVDQKGAALAAVIVLMGSGGQDGRNERLGRTGQS
jgi:hypothetical protein